MTGRRHPPYAAVAWGAFLAGLAAWIWLGDWRWAVTGLLLMAVIAMVGAVRRADHTIKTALNDQEDQT